MQPALFTSEVHLLWFTTVVFFKAILYSTKKNSEQCRRNTEVIGFPNAFLKKNIVFFFWDFFLLRSNLQIKLTLALLKYSGFIQISIFHYWGIQAYFHKANVVSS